MTPIAAARHSPLLENFLSIPRTACILSQGEPVTAVPLFPCAHLPGSSGASPPSNLVFSSSTTRVVEAILPRVTEGPSPVHRSDV